MVLTMTTLGSQAILQILLGFGCDYVSKGKKLEQSNLTLNRGGRGAPLIFTKAK